MVLQRSKHSSSPTHLWFHLGRWLHSQLYVPSGHTWSIPVKEMCAVSKQGKKKLCIPQEGKERLQLVANCEGYGKTCSWSPVAGNAKANHEQKAFKSLWRSLSSNYRESISNSDCRFSSSIHLIYMTDFLRGCTFTSWAKWTIIMKLVLVKTNKKLKKQFKINKITLLNFQQRPFQVSLRLIFHMVH